MSFSQVEDYQRKGEEVMGSFPSKFPPKKVRTLLFGEEVMIHESCVCTGSQRRGILRCSDASIYNELESTPFL